MSGARSMSHTPSAKSATRPGGHPHGQSGLADASGAGKRDEAGGGENAWELEQLRLAPDEARHLGWQIVTTRRGREERCHSSIRPRRRVRDLHRRHEPIAFARHGLDVSRRFARVSQRLTDLEDGGVNTGVGVGEYFGPQSRFAIVLARHQLLPALQQQEQDFHGLPRQPRTRVPPCRTS